ncbi:MAG: peptidylprolyl isomerase [candidate division KSB1 bacterium]|nr:peptidylprolyl isomerase [candidate division KSB1 bacterium]
METAKIVLTDLIDQRLVIRSAFRDSLHLDSTVVSKRKERKENLVYMQVIHEKVYNEEIPISKLRKIYDRQGLEFGISHIFMRVTPQMTPHEVTMAREKLETVYQKLLRGAEFDKMAQTYSQDKKTAGKGGWIGFLRWGARGYGDRFYMALKDMHKGDFSKVLKSTKGFHIVKLRAVRKREQMPFDEKIQALRKQYFQHHSDEINNRYSEFIDRLREKYDFQLNEDTVDSLLVWFDTEEYDFQMNTEFEAFINSLTPEQKRMPVYSYVSDTVSVETFLKQIIKNVIQGGRPPFTMRRTWDRFIFLDSGKFLLLEYGYEKNYAKKDTVQKQLKTFVEKEIVDLQVKKNIDDQLNLTEADYRKYYADHKERFQRNPQVVVQEIFVSDKEKAEWLYNRIQNGEDFGSLAERYTERDSVKSRQGVLGYVSPVRHREMGRKATTMLPGEISEPVYFSGGYSVIKILERQPGEPQSFRRVRGRVMAVVKKQRRDQLWEEWISELRSECNVVMFEHVLNDQFRSAEK